MSFILGITIALLAILVALTLAQRGADSGRPSARWLRPLASPTLRGGVSRSLIALAIIPALALAILGSAKRAADYAERDTEVVADGAVTVARQLDAFLLRHAAGVRSAAEAITLDGDTSDERLGQWLLRYHPIYADFRTMLVAGPDGEIRTGTSRTDGGPTLVRTERRSVADRGYFRVPMTTGSDYISDGFRGRGFGTDPLIAVSSPILIRGERWGVVEGSLNLLALRRLDASLAELADAQLIITDRSGAVLHASERARLDFLDPLTTTIYAPALRADRHTELSTPGQAAPLLVGHARTASGWHVFVTKPKPSWQELLRQIGWLSAGWLLVCAAAAGTLAWALANRISRPMRRLETALAGYTFGHSSPFRRMTGLPVEYQYVFRRLHGFVVRLAAGHRRLAAALRRAGELETELRHTLESREQEIAERTAQLAEANAQLDERNRALQISEEHFRALAECASVAILVCRPDGDCQFANAQWTGITGLAPGESTGHGWERVFDTPEPIRSLIEAHPASASPKEPALARITTVDGQTRWLQTRVAEVRTARPVDSYVMCTFEDVTELVESRQLVRDLAQRIESAKEEERRALAQTLHEGIAQDVFAAKLSLAQTRKHADDPAAVRKWADDTDAIVGGVLQALRHVTSEVWPTGIDRLSMPEILRWHAERFSARAGFPIDVHESIENGAGPFELSEEARLVLFRAVQEALTNVVKHAGATHASVTLAWFEGAVGVTVVDNGHGSAALDQRKTGSFGLVGLRERLRPLGGTVLLQHDPAVGTVFYVHLPASACRLERSLRHTA